MGYELHVVRTSTWLKASEKPILRAEVDEMVKADPELAWSKTDHLNGQFDIIEWNGLSAFYWDTKEIVGKGLLEPQIIKLCEIAERLEARVLGDEDEEYKVQSGIFGRKKLTNNWQDIR